MNVAVAPATFQLPAIFGESVGNGVAGESAEENVSVTGAAAVGVVCAARGGYGKQAQRLGLG